MFVLDDLTFDASVDMRWLSENPISGTIAAGSFQPVNVTFNAGVPEVTQPGQYHATLNVGINDPFSGTLAVPVTMTVNLPLT